MSVIIEFVIGDRVSCIMPMLITGVMSFQSAIAAFQKENMPSQGCQNIHLHPASRSAEQLFPKQK